MLSECAKDPSRKRVRILRTLTLRLRVALEQSLVGQSSGSTATKLFRHWKKKGKMLRRALQPVRDVDVCLAKLDVLRNTLRGSPIVELRKDGRSQTQIEELEERLRQRRTAEAENLTATIDAHGKRLRRLSKELELAVSLADLSNVCPTRLAALRVFEGLVSKYDHLDRSNLHLYRKRLKEALYLAEIAAVVDPLAGELAAKFRKFHDASGEWHDWELLVLEARLISPSKGKNELLVSSLEGKAAAALQDALRAYRSFRGRPFMSTR